MRLRGTLLAIASMILMQTSALAQTAEAKVNVAAGALAIFNPSFEIGFNHHSAVTFDYVGAFAQENYLGTGNPFLISMGMWGYRYYLEADSHSGWFFGGDGGLYAFRMEKNVIPFVRHDHGQGYDVGYGYMFGATAGYKRRISDHFSVEASISGGWCLSIHESYHLEEGVRDTLFNPSYEWLPYKGGIYLVYHFW